MRTNLYFCNCNFHIARRTCIDDIRRKDGKSSIFDICWFHHRTSFAPPKLILIKLSFNFLEEEDLKHFTKFSKRKCKNVLLAMWLCLFYIVFVKYNKGWICYWTFICSIGNISSYCNTSVVFLISLLFLFTCTLNFLFSSKLKVMFNLLVDPSLQEQLFSIYCICFKILQASKSWK